MKYIIDVPDNTQWIQWMNVSEKDGSARFDYKAPENLTPYVRSESYIDGLKKGQNEVWEFAKKVGLRAFFDDNHNLHPYLDYFDSYQDAKAKHEELKAERDQIRVGDEVEQISESGKSVGCKCVVTKIVGDEILKGISKTGEVVTCSSQVKRWWRKTGRHFNEVEELLRKFEEKYDE